MTTLTITIDESIETQLRSMGKENGLEPAQLASRLLKRAVLAACPRPAYDFEAIRANAAEFESEDLALADSDPDHRAQLLTDEDVQ